MDKNTLVLDQTQWALLISLAMLIFFMTAFFISSSRRKGKVRRVRSGKPVVRTEPTQKHSQYETITNWISLRKAGALSPGGLNGSQKLSEGSLPQEIRGLINELGLEIAVLDLHMTPEPRVQLEISVNEKGYFELGKRKGLGPFEYTLPRVTNSVVNVEVVQPFINLKEEQTFFQVRFGRLKKVDQWRMVFEIQNITNNYTHIDFEIFWERVDRDEPAKVNLVKGDTKP